MLFEGGTEVPLPTEPAPELPLPELPDLTAPRSLGLPSFGSIVVLFEGGTEVPPAPELTPPELPVLELPVAELPLRGLPWFFSITVLSRFGAPLDVPLALPELEPPKLEPLAEERVTPNALAVLLSSCPLVWIFCARWKARNAC